MNDQQKMAGVLFNSSAPGNWCLTRRGVQPWMSISIARTDDESIAGTIETNDIKRVKETLASTRTDLHIKSFQVVVPGPLGLNVVEVCDFIEATSDSNEVFHIVRTRLGELEIDGSGNLRPLDLTQYTCHSLYKLGIFPEHTSGTKNA